MFEKIYDMIAIAAPIRVIERPESLTIMDYRPTLVLALCLPAGLAMMGLSIWLIIALGTEAMFAVVICGLLAIVAIVFALQQTVREVYYFDKAKDSYCFIRQFVFRREVIEGSMEQFTGASVKTVTNDESNSYFVVLNQEGMFLTGVSEQTLREEAPIFNTFSNEATIANAISSAIHTARYERKKKQES
jgi:hypothetical protein